MSERTGRFCAGRIELAVGMNVHTPTAEVTVGKLSTWKRKKNEKVTTSNELVNIELTCRVLLDVRKDTRRHFYSSARIDIVLI